MKRARAITVSLTPDDILDRQAIADIADVDVETVGSWRRRHPDDFPPPDGYVSGAPWWFRWTVEPWLAKPRRPGRPSSKAS